jgi:saccharopine dehydrogenase-like NADP-dependent oxidoreductase
MARVTAFPATTVARMLHRGLLREPGVHPPEVIGADPSLFEPFLVGLAERGIRLLRRDERP